VKLKSILIDRHSLIFSVIILVSLFSYDQVFADISINDVIQIDTLDLTKQLLSSDNFGHVVENIGDLDTDGNPDFAVIALRSDVGIFKNAGSIVILFMNANGTVRESQQINHIPSGLGASCIGPNSEAVGKNGFESLALIGDLDGDGMPTLALGVTKNKHTFTQSGAIYMLELNVNGTVNNCLPIIPGTNGFSPDDSFYPYENSAFLGRPLIATDLNGDGQNELLAGAKNNDLTRTNIWPLFLNSTGAVDSHPIEPIFGRSDLGLVNNDYLRDGDSINGTNKIVVGSYNQNSNAEDGGSIFIVDISATGEFEASQELLGTSLGLGIDSTDRFGNGLTSLGDLNGDGVVDLSVGNNFGDDINVDSGESFILLMNSDNTISDSTKISNDSIFGMGGIVPSYKTGDLFGTDSAIWKQSCDTSIVAISVPLGEEKKGKEGLIHMFTLTHSGLFPDLGFGDCSIHYSIDLSDGIIISDEVTVTKLGKLLYLNDNISISDEVTVTLIRATSNDPPPSGNSDPPSGNSDPPKKTGNVKVSEKSGTSITIVKTWVTSENNFVSGINHLIITGLIDGSKIKSLNSSPGWVIEFLGNAWIKKEISDQDYFNAIEYLLKNEILK